MMRTLFALPLLAFGLAACEPKTPLMTETDDVAVAAMVADCAAHAEKPWAGASPGGYRIEAVTFGPTCQQAVATLVVRAPDGDPVLAWSGPAMHIFGLSDATAGAGMDAALKAWIDQDNSTLGSTLDLPEWTVGKDAPGGEFPFYTESWVDRPTYDGLRRQAAPLFAFPQGMESLAVYLLRDGQLEPIGVQAFPG